MVSHHHSWNIVVQFGNTQYLECSCETCKAREAVQSFHTPRMAIDTDWLGGIGVIPRNLVQDSELEIS